MAARESALGSPADPQILYGPLSRREKLELHLAVFFVGSGSLVIADVARTPHSLWFWPWVTGWAGLLLVHCAAVLAQRFGSLERRGTNPLGGTETAGRSLTPGERTTWKPRPGC